MAMHWPAEPALSDKWMDELWPKQSPRSSPDTVAAVKGDRQRWQQSKVAAVIGGGGSGGGGGGGSEPRPKSLRGTVAAAGKGGRGDSGSRGGSGRRSKSRPKQRPGESPDEPMIKQRTGAGR